MNNQRDMTCQEKVNTLVNSASTEEQNAHIRANDRDPQQTKWKKNAGQQMLTPLQTS